MYFLALATDYDGTLAHDGVVSAETIDALQRFKTSGRHLILVTGREISDLKAVMPDLTVFDIIVAENGALLYHPATGSERLLGKPPSVEFVDKLRMMGVAPLSIGRGIVATWQPHEATVLSAIRQSGLDLQIIFNKGAVMVLPSGVSKASGLREALSELGVSALNTVGVGDAENDHSFLSACGCSAAVSNALPNVSASVDICLKNDHGTGVAELIDLILEQDVELAPQSKHGIQIGVDVDDCPTFLMPQSGHVLVVGPSGTGKSTLTTTMTEQMVDLGLSFCVMDPEGDYYELQHAVCVGSAAAPPNILDALRLQQDAGVNLVVNSQALNLSGRRKLFRRLLSEASLLCENTGRPHWIVIDEAHEVVPAGRSDSGLQLLSLEPNVVFVTMYPEALDADVLKAISTVLAFGENPSSFLAAFAKVVGARLPVELPSPRGGEMLCWHPKDGLGAVTVRPLRPKQIHRRHVGKYATGDVGPWHSFYFRGEHGQCSLVAHNLYDFIEMADVIDDATWKYHLRAGHYSSWFRDVIRDRGLAQDTRVIEENQRLDEQESRRLIRKAIWRRYAAPCERFNNTSLLDSGMALENAVHND